MQEGKDSAGRGVLGCWRHKTITHHRPAACVPPLRCALLHSQGGPRFGFHGEVLALYHWHWLAPARSWRSPGIDAGPDWAAALLASTTIIASEVVVDKPVSCGTYPRVI